MIISKIISFFILSVLLTLPQIAFGLGAYGANIGLLNIFDNITTMAWILFTGVVVVCFIVSGIIFLTAMGDATKLKTARSAFIWGIVGVVVGLIAYSIIAIVSSILGA